MSALPPPVSLLTGATGVVPVGSSVSSRGVKLVRFSGPTLAGDRDLAKSLEEIATHVRDIGAQALGNPYASSVLVRNVVLKATSPTLVSHYLGRAVTTWSVNRIRPPGPPGATSLTNCLVWESNPQPTNCNPLSQIELNATVSCLVDLLFA